MIRFFLKEAGMLTAFVILAGLLLLCLWVSENFQRNVFKDFQNTQISVVIKDRGEPALKELLANNSNVVQYKIYRSKDNKDRLGQLYPELKNLIGPLEDKFFPTSAIVAVKDGPAFLSLLKLSPQIVETQIVHQPPMELARFIQILTFIFSLLWLLTLTLVLYFNLERLTAKEQARWSLMKMLGERPERLFLPLLYGQSLRIGVASVFAILIALISVFRVRTMFAWNWSAIPFGSWVGFFALSLLMTAVISFVLFYQRFKRVTLG
ncbi:MAG: hypothetical protein J0L93_04205 [Deltaproteobacteria bacterium]|nr:hypothetical protein [Deltaproteobacteria bacterium]